MFERLRKLFKKQKQEREPCPPENNIYVAEQRGDKMVLIETVPRDHFPGVDVGNKKPEPTSQTKISQSFRPYRNIHKTIERDRIAMANLEKQKSVLGYGLKSRNFRPRPASEKRLWKLDKKPEED